MGKIKINGELQLGSNEKDKLIANANRAYGTYRFPVFTIDGTTTTRSATITLNCTGRPVFLICTGDINPQTGTGDWCDVALYRDDGFLKKITVQGTNTSQNGPFGVSFLDDGYSSIGSHVYRVTFTRGGGTLLFGEQSGEYDAPVFTAFEI